MTRKRVNLYLNAAAVERAKKAGYNISALARNAINAEIKKIKQNKEDTNYESQRIRQAH